MAKRKCLSCNKVKAVSMFNPDRYKKSKDRCRECTRVMVNENRRSMGNRYGDYRFEARRRGFAFDLSRDQFNIITSKKCYYCGGFSGKFKNSRFNGIDRMSANEGYYEHNCVPCCMTCNYMKLRLETDDFIKHVKKIFKYQSA